jgi:hypothetical protein
MIIMDMNNRNDEGLDFVTSDSLQENKIQLNQIAHSMEISSLSLKEKFKKTSQTGSTFPLKGFVRLHRIDGIFGSPSVQDGKIIQRHGKELNSLDPLLY